MEMGRGMDGDVGQAYGRVSEEVEGQWRQLVRSGEVFADVRPASPAAGRVCCHNGWLVFQSFDSGVSAYSVADMACQPRLWVLMGVGGRPCMACPGVPQACTAEVHLGGGGGQSGAAGQDWGPSPNGLRMLGLWQCGRSSQCAQAAASDVLVWQVRLLCCWAWG